MSSLWPLQVFDRNAEYSVVERKLPHWLQAGTLCFITWRTKDSIPQSVLRRWFADRDAWLRRHDIDPGDINWKGRLFELDLELRAEFVKTFSEKWHRYLDNCRGACVLRRPAIRQIVIDSFKKFDGERYELTDVIVMPNHVHVLAAFKDEAGMLEQCESWKHFMAWKINKTIGESGPFWQQDGFDHLVRTEYGFQALRKYIAENGTKAKLSADDFYHYSKPLAGLKK